MHKVNLTEQQLFSLLIDRVKFWTQDEIVLNLYRDYYANQICCGCFENANLDIEKIVDNDYINYCSVIQDGDADYEGVAKAYHKNGLGDCSDENIGFNYIEAECDGVYLVRT